MELTTTNKPFRAVYSVDENRNGMVKLPSIAIEDIK
jgi:hypothetical protein